MRLDARSACPQWRALHAGDHALPARLLSLAEPRARHRARPARLHRHLSAVLRNSGEWAARGLGRDLRRHRRRAAASPALPARAARCWPTTDILYCRTSTTSSSCESLQHAAARLSGARRAHDHLLPSRPSRGCRSSHAFQAVPPRPFTNIKVRVRNDRFGFFRNMDDGFRRLVEASSANMPAAGPTCPTGAIWLTDIGSDDDPKPADWLWQYPDRQRHGAEWSSCTMATT